MQCCKCQFPDCPFCLSFGGRFESPPFRTPSLKLPALEWTLVTLAAHGPQLLISLVLWLQSPGWRLQVLIRMGGKGLNRYGLPHLGAPSRGLAPSLVFHALRAPFFGYVFLYLVRVGCVCQEGGRAHGHCCLFWAFSGFWKISDASSGQDISKTPLGVLPVPKVFRSNLGILEEWASCPQQLSPTCFSKCWFLRLPFDGGCFSGLCQCVG